jgi:hypothetical protein
MLPIMSIFTVPRATYALNGIFFALNFTGYERTGCNLPQILTAADCNTRNLSSGIEGE